jgi:hypothetical protein
MAKALQKEGDRIVAASDFTRSSRPQALAERPFGASCDTKAAPADEISAASEFALLS